MTAAAEPPGAPEYLSVDQIAAELGVHPQTAQRWFREQGLPGRKIGRSWTTTRAAFNAWLTCATTTEPAGGLDLETKAR